MWILAAACSALFKCNLSDIHTPSTPAALPADCGGDKNDRGCPYECLTAKMTPIIKCWADVLRLQQQ